MIVGRYDKHPVEIVPLSADFVCELERDSDTIVSMAVTAENVETGLDSGAEILQGSPLLGDSIIVNGGVPLMTGSRIIQRVQSGAPGDQHLLTYTAQTALGSRWEGGILVYIKEP